MPGVNTMPQKNRAPAAALASAACAASPTMDAANFPLRFASLTAGTPGVTRIPRR
jgi:hypothetical protein